MLNPGEPKCDEDLITLDTYVEQGKQLITSFSYMPQYENINIFGYLGGRGGGGREGLQNKTGPILIHIYPLLYINLHVKHGSNLIRTFWVKIQIMNKKLHCFFSHCGSLHKIQRYCGHQNVGKCWPHHTGDICTTWEKLTTGFSYMGQNMNTFIYYWGALGDPQWSYWTYLAFQVSSDP